MELSVKYTSKQISGVIVLESKVFADERSWFVVSLNQVKFQSGFLNNKVYCSKNVCLL